MCGTPNPDFKNESGQKASENSSVIPENNSAVPAAGQGDRQLWAAAPNPQVTELNSQTTELIPENANQSPRTIEELRKYCLDKGMPLSKMRFFIGTDFREPRAFGIFRDGENFIVYKNKSDGSRTIRYSGSDEAYAVNELYQKILDECHKRGIYPDGRQNKITSFEGRNITDSPVYQAISKSRYFPQIKNTFLIILLVLIIMAILRLGNSSTNQHSYGRSQGYEYSRDRDYDYDYDDDDWDWDTDDTDWDSDW